MSRTTCWYVTSTLLLGGAVACHSARPVLPSTAPMTSASLAAPVRPAPPPPAPPAPTMSPTPAPTETPLSEDDLFRRKSLDELNAEHPLADAFFAYDQADLRDADRKALDTDATWLLKWTQTGIEIDGYCDERGSDEYNLALGDRRARAARDYLVDLGVPSSRIHIVSYGKERSFCQQATESCWQENRRAHFLITAK